MLLCVASCGEPSAPSDAPATTDEAPVIVQPRLSAGALQQFLTEWDSVFAMRFDSSKCPGGAVVVVQDSQVVFEKGYGLANTRDATPVGLHTAFRLGSLSKGFAGVLVGMAVAAGKLRLDERVKDILPEFALNDSAQTERIRVWHLLSHCTGLPRHTYTSKVEGKENRETVLCELFDVPLVGAEGTVFAYQNFSFSLIEEILQLRMGKPYAQLVEEYIFAPAGMTDASITAENWFRTPDKALPHSNDRAGNFHPMPLNDKYFNAPSAGGVTASISDMGQWLKVLLGARPDLAPRAVLDTTFKRRVETNSRAFAHRWEGSLASYYGLGWRIMDMGGHEIICHGGHVNHYRTEIALDRATGLGVCFLFNAVCSYQADAPPDFFKRYHDAVEAQMAP